jgi:hypothetical protein
LSAESYLAENTPESPYKVRPESWHKRLSGKKIVLPRHSLTIIEFIRQGEKGGNRQEQSE